MPRSSGGGRGRSFGGGGRPSGGGYRGYSTSRSPSSGGGYRSSSSGYRSTSQAPRGTPSSPAYNTLSRPAQGMGLGSMLATGMAFGAGSSLAHHAVGGMFGRSPSAHGYPSETARPESSQPVPYYEQASSNTTTESYQKESELEKQIKANPCYDYNMKFIDCLKQNDKDISRCQTLFNDMISCEKSLV